MIEGKKANPLMNKYGFANSIAGAPSVYVFKNTNVRNKVQIYEKE